MRKLLKLLEEHWELAVSLAALLWSILRGIPALLLLGAVALAILCAVHEFKHWGYVTWPSNPLDPDREYLRRVLSVVHGAFTALVIAIPVLSIGGFEFVTYLPTWTDTELMKILNDRHLTENVERDTLTQGIPPCAHGRSHVGLITPTAVTLLPSEPTFRILLRPYSEIPPAVACVSSLLLLVVLFVLWMAELIISARATTVGPHTGAPGT